MTPKIIELIIQDGDEEAGLDGIALVEMPAHEADFQFFNKQQDNKHYVLSDEEVPQVIQMFHAYGEPQGLLEKEGWYIAELRNVGKQDFQIISNPDETSAQDTNEVRYRYKYVGPKDDKNRTFCAEMMGAGKVFRIEDIMTMSDRSINPVGPDGYDMFTWRGSYNCRHRWVQLIYRREGRIINSDKVERGLLETDNMPGPDTRTTATIEAGNTPPRVGFSSSNPDVSALPPYTDEVGGELVRKPVLASLPLFDNREDAEALAKVMGCKGSHEHKYGDVTLYMPCEKHPEDFAEECPPETQDIKLNLANRQKAIDDANYGPQNPNEPNEAYWKKKADMFQGNVEDAKKALCANCSFFDQKKKTLDCIAEGIGGEDAYDSIEAGDLGVCLAYDFKCASQRTCDAWVAGGPIKDDFAEIGPRGGIKESDKAPKSNTPNKNPQGEGSAKGDASGKRGAKVTAEQEKTLQKKVDDFNEKDSNTKNGRATLGALKSVFQRGLGAFNVSHSPKVQSSEQWAYARVNAFLYLLKNGRPENPKYKTDYDLLPKDHPKYNMSINIEIECDECGWEWDIEDGGDEPFICHKCGYDNTPTEIDQDGNYIVGNFASYDDYPALIRKNAQAALDYIEKTGNPRGCMTQVGKVRAQQLAQGKPISLETVKRMKAYITRHKVDLESSKSYDDGCGKLAMDAWGGVEALNWVESTIKKNEEMSTESEMTFSVFNNEKKLVVGPAMIPDKMIIRRNEITGEIYYVYFTAETIVKLQQKFMQEKLLDKTNIEHGRRFLNGVDVVESWIVEDPEKDKQQVFGMNYPKGTWMCIVKVDDENTWQMVKDGKLKGFSVQGYFLERAKFNAHTHQVLDEIKNILNEVR